MTVQIEALTCPTCGAPVSIRGTDTLTLCIYCNGALRIHRPAAGPTELAADMSLSRDATARIKDLITVGKRAEAVALHQAETHCDRVTSEAAIDAYVTRIVTDSIFSSTLNGVGIAMYLGAFALVVGGIALGVSGTAPWFVAVVLAVFGGLHLLALWKVALRTVRYLSASAGTATILRHAVIGRAKGVVSYRLLLEVRDSSGATFRAEKTLPVPEARVSRITEGRQFRVKYFAGDPSSVVATGKVENNASK